MAVQKFITNNNGTFTEVKAIDTSTGVADAGKVPALGTDGKLASGFMPSNIGTPTAMVVASEALASGAFVNIYDDAGTIKARNADATDGTKRANGFVLTAVASAGIATVYLQGENTALTGLTIGSEYFLAAAATGTVTTTSPSAPGNSFQSIGTAINATTIIFLPQKNIILA
jgi:hypothetical protein